MAAYTVSRDTGKETMSQTSQTPYWSGDSVARLGPYFSVPGKALYWACRVNRVGSAARLMHHVTHVDAWRSGVDAGTALHIAADWGSTEAVTWLLLHGADHMPEDGTGNTPKQLARQKGYVRTADVLLHYTQFQHRV